MKTIFVILATILDIIAIIDIFKSRMSGGKKLLWFLVILILPIIGMIAYFLIGKNSGSDASS